METKSKGREFIILVNMPREIRTLTVGIGNNSCSEQQFYHYPRSTLANTFRIYVPHQKHNTIPTHHNSYYVHNFQLATLKEDVYTWESASGTFHVGTSTWCDIQPMSLTFEAPSVLIESYSIWGCISIVLKGYLCMVPTLIQSSATCTAPTPICILLDRPRRFNCILSHLKL